MHQTSEALSRRRVLGHAITTAVAGGIAGTHARAGEGERHGEKPAVRDRLWLWGHDAGAHDKSWGLPRPSRMTPAESCLYMGVPNLIMVRYEGKPAMPFDQYSVPFRALRRVVWSVVGAGGRTNEKERAHVLELAGRNPFLTGVMMDDFFIGAFEAKPKDGRLAALTLEQVRDLREKLASGKRKLDLWAVLYEHQLDRALKDYIKLLDKVSFWTWDSAHLKDLERNFEKVEALAPDCGKVLGCYMWDYGKKRAMPPQVMQRQCELGLRWLTQGRIEGMIFLATCICDLDLEAVEWTRDWIARVGDRPL